MFNVVQFRDIENSSRPDGRRSKDGNAKLSFRKLARDTAGKSGNGKSGVNNGRQEQRKGLYEKASVYLNGVLGAIRNRRGFALEPGFRIIEKIAAVDHPQDQLFIMAIHLDDRFKYVIHHSVNVAIYAVKLAAELGFTRSRQIELGMAGLLHDVGLAAIPDRILYKQEQLSQEESDILRGRVNYSYKILKACGDELAYLAECAGQVYERIDGSGYPRQLMGDEIHEYAQIIGLLDMYEALVHSRPQREKMTHFTALKEIINTCKHRFQRRHLKALLNIFTAFPIYSYVRLNSEAIGKVIETYPDQPMRPKLKILYDSQKRRVLTERIIVLPENPLLNIVDSVSEQEIRELSGA